MANRSAELHYAGGLPQLGLGGAALLIGAVNLAESLAFQDERVAFPALSWLSTVLVFAAVAYWPFRGGLRAAPTARGMGRFGPLGLLVAVLFASLVMAIAGGLMEAVGAPLLPRIALGAAGGAALAAIACVWRIRALVLFAAVVVAAAGLLAVLEAHELRLGFGLPLLTGFLLAGDGALRWSRRRTRPQRPVAGSFLPGADVQAVRRAARRGMEVWFEDGSPLLQIGGSMIASGLLLLLEGATQPGSPTAVVFLVGPFLLVTLIGFGTVASRWFKERVTEPRSGSVEPRPPRAAVVVLMAVIAVLVAAGVAWPPVFGELRRGSLRPDIWPLEQLALPFVTGVFVAGLAAWAAWVSGIATLYRAAALALVLGVLLSFSTVRGYSGAGIVSLVAGAVIAADGALRMRRYLRRTSA